MKLKEFENKLNEIRARNDWYIEIECRGIYIIKIRDKLTDEILGETGVAGSLEGVLIALEHPLSSSIWGNQKGK